jgi:hypothetical protein
MLAPFGPEPSVFSSAVSNCKIRIYKTTILPVVLYGCETWSLTLGVLRGIFGPRRDEKVKKIWARHVARIGEKRNAYRLLVGQS